MKDSNTPYITNLVNSIIGVSVLAMPFCMKKCGLLLGLGLLIGMSWLTYVSCNMLVTAAQLKRRRTYEYLAFYTVGPNGKFAAELCMIGLMLGTCTAFYVIIGDLATAILHGQVNANPEQLRTFVIVFCALCIALPLGLMKNLSVLGFIGFISVLFYFIFVCIIVANSISHGLLSLKWIEKIELFRPAGVFQCLPIFGLAYACQCQLFTVYSSLEDASLLRMERIVVSSLKIVTFVYCMVAIFGYVTYLDVVEGNILKNFSPNIFLDFIKLGFALSVVVGFPLMIFPCRQSIYTLFFSPHPADGVASNTYIEPFLFKSITLCIVLATMMVSLFIPNVETILGLTGATMGSFICFILPGAIFTRASPKEDSGISKFVLLIGCVLLIVCTYSNIYSATNPDPPKVEPEIILPNLQPNIIVDIKDQLDKQPIAEIHDADHRHEPANPIEPIIPDNPEIDKFPEIQKDFAEIPKEKIEERQAIKEENDHLNEADIIDKESKQILNEDKELLLKDQINDKLINKNDILDKIQNDLQPKETKDDAQIANPNAKLENDDKDSKIIEDTKEQQLKDIEAKNDDLSKSDNRLENLAENIDEEKLLHQIKENQKYQKKLLQAEEVLIKALEQNVQKQDDSRVKADKNNVENKENVLQAENLPQKNEINLKKDELIKNNVLNPNVPLKPVNDHLESIKNNKPDNPVENKLPQDVPADARKKDSIELDENASDIHRVERDVENVAKKTDLDKKEIVPKASPIDEINVKKDFENGVANANENIKENNDLDRSQLKSFEDDQNENIGDGIEKIDKKPNSRDLKSLAYI